MRLSLILPASASVAPAVFAFLARSDPEFGGQSADPPTINVLLLTSQVDNRELQSAPRRGHAPLGPSFGLDTKESMTSRADTVTSGPGNPSLHEAGFQDHQCLIVASTDHLAQSRDEFSIG